MQRALPDGVQRHGGGERLGIDQAVQDRRLPRSQGALEGGRELLRALHPLAVPTEAARQRREVRVPEPRGRHPPRIFALLMHADRAVHAVVQHHDDDRQGNRIWRLWLETGVAGGGVAGL